MSEEIRSTIWIKVIKYTIYSFSIPVAVKPLVNTCLVFFSLINIPGITFSPCQQPWGFVSGQLWKNRTFRSNYVSTLCFDTKPFRSSDISTCRSPSNTESMTCNHLPKFLYVQEAIYKCLCYYWSISNYQTEITRSWEFFNQCFSVYNKILT